MSYYMQSMTEEKEKKRHKSGGNKRKAGPEKAYLE